MTIDFARADNGSIYLERGFWHAAAMVSSASNRVGRPFTFVCDAPEPFSDATEVCLGRAPWRRRNESIMSR